jgi:hypothetical protein
MEIRKTRMMKAKAELKLSLLKIKLFTHKHLTSIRKPMEKSGNGLICTKNIFFSNHFYVFLLLCISLISILWFRGDFQIAMGDYLFPPGRIEAFQRSFYSWDHFSLGSDNFRILTYVFPFGIYLALTEVMKIPLVISEKIWVYLSFASMGLSMYFLTITIVKEKFRYLAGFLAALLFMFNPWTAILNAMLWPYIVFLPLILGLYIKGLNERRDFIYIFFFCLLWTLTSTASWMNIRGGLLQLMTLIIYLVFFLITNWKKSEIKHALGFSVTLLFYWGLLNMFWILPVFTNLFKILQNTSLVYQDIGFSWMDAYNLNSVHLADAFHLMGFWGLEGSFKGYPYIYWSSAYITPAFILIGFLFPILTFSALLVKQSDDAKKYQLFFSIITVFGIFIMMGSLNNLNLWFAKNVPFFVTLFSIPYYYGGIFVVIGFSVLTGFSISLFLTNSLKGIKHKFLKCFGIALVFLLVGGYGFPVWSGEFIYPGNEILSSARFNTPLYYQDARAWLDGQDNYFRIFSLPYSRLGYMSYTWPPAGFNGVDPSPYLLNRDVIIGTGFGQNVTKELSKSNISGLNKLLGIMNVKYVLVHNDANIKFIENNSWYIYPIPNFFKFTSYENDNTLPHNSFGKLDFYKIPDNYFLPHIYSAAPILVQGSIDDMLKLVISDNFTIGNNALFLSDQMSKSQLESLKKSRYIESNYGPTITFQEINPTRYEVKVENATYPFFVVFLDSYNSEWKAYIDNESNMFSEITTQYNKIGVSETRPEMKFSLVDISYLFKNPIDDDKHFLANGYANAWYINPHELGTGKNFTMTLYFKPQSYFYIGLIISGFTFMVCIGYLVWDWKRKDIC